MKGPLCAPPPRCFISFLFLPIHPVGVIACSTPLLLTDWGPHPVFMEVFPLLFMGAALLYGMNNK